MSQYLKAAINLYKYLVAAHWNGQSLIGPDPGARFNRRLGRFIKSYFPQIDWRDDYYYLQAQGYWILGNWLLFSRMGDEAYREMAIQCSETMLLQQQDDGAWLYPFPGWKGRVATAEGTWGVLGLLETFRQTAQQKFLAGVLDWHKFLIEKIGFQQVGDELAVNYFADSRDKSRIPNNTAFVLRFFAELTDVTNDKMYLQPCTAMLTFMKRVQKPSGEFPYAVESVADNETQPHFQCYQYNAFQCLDLIRYYELTADPAAIPPITKVLAFLSQGLAPDGHAYQECGNLHTQVTYHTAALGAAFAKAGQAGLDNYLNLANRAYARLLKLQQPEGGFPHSQGEYRLFRDRRSYPRYLSMILYHLLVKESEDRHDVSDNR